MFANRQTDKPLSTFATEGLESELAPDRAASCSGRLEAAWIEKHADVCRTRAIHISASKCDPYQRVSCKIAGFDLLELAHPGRLDLNEQLIATGAADD